jgi:hypothetical protein
MKLRRGNGFAIATITVFLLLAAIGPLRSGFALAQAPRPSLGRRGLFALPERRIGFQPIERQRRERSSPLSTNPINVASAAWPRLFCGIVGFRRAKAKGGDIGGGFRRKPRFPKIEHMS